MALMPKRVKFRKSQKGRVRGNATRGNYVAFGEFGLQALEPGRISAQTIEAGRVVASQMVKGGGKLYIRDLPPEERDRHPGRDPDGQGQGRNRILGGRGQAGHDPLRDQRPERGGGPRDLRPRGPQDADHLPVRRPPAHDLSHDGQASWPDRREEM